MLSAMTPVIIETGTNTIVRTGQGITKATAAMMSDSSDTAAQRECEYTFSILKALFLLQRYKYFLE